MISTAVFSNFVIQNLLGMNIMSGIGTLMNVPSQLKKLIASFQCLHLPICTNEAADDLTLLLESKVFLETHEIWSDCNLILGVCRHCLYFAIHSKKKSTSEHLFWCFRLSQIEDSIHYLEGPNSSWKDLDRNLGVQMGPSRY